jgi:hypothetical protein
VDLEPFFAVWKSTECFGSGFQIFELNTDPDPEPEPDPGFSWPKIEFTAEKIFDQKLQLTYP